MQDSVKFWDINTAEQLDIVMKTQSHIFDMKLGLEFFFGILGIIIVL